MGQGWSINFSNELVQKFGTLKFIKRVSVCEFEAVLSLQVLKNQSSVRVNAVVNIYFISKLGIAVINQLKISAGTSSVTGTDLLTAL
jgi:hypothetical protein